MHFQEYVDAPFLIKLKSEQISRTVTRSSISSDDLFVTESYQIGSIYVVLAEPEDFEDGFVLVRCQSVNPASIVGVYLERCPDGSDHEDVYNYKESCEVSKIAKESVHTSLISINLVNPVEKIYSVDRVEIEEVLFSINS